MFQKALFVFGIFVSIHAFAEPVTGDQVSYTLTHVKGEWVDNVFSMTKEVLAIDDNAQTVSVRQIYSQNGKTLSNQTAAAPAGSVAYPDDATIATCGIISYPGQTGLPETITVAAGTFNTCHIVLDNNAGEFWAAAVPFGFVKSVNTNSTGTMTVELTSFLKK